MSDNVTPISDEAARQKALVEAFTAAAEKLGNLDADILLGAHEQVRAQHVDCVTEDVLGEIPHTLDRNDIFYEVVFDYIYNTVVPNLGAAFEGHNDQTKFAEIIENHKAGLIQTLKDTARDNNWLPRMANPFS